MELQRGHAVEGIIDLPLVGGAITAGLEEAMEDGEENRTFDVEAEAAVAEELAENGLATGIAPQAFEDKDGTEPLDGQGWQGAVVMGGEEDRLLGKACAGGEETFESSILLEVIESPEGGDDALMGAAVGQWFSTICKYCRDPDGLMRKNMATVLQVRHHGV
jgi:hypothetical protein